MFERFLVSPESECSPWDGGKMSFWGEILHALLASEAKSRQHTWRSVRRLSQRYWIYTSEIKNRIVRSNAWWKEVETRKFPEHGIYINASVGQA